MAVVSATTTVLVATIIGGERIEQIKKNTRRRLKTRTSASENSGKDHQACGNRTERKNTKRNQIGATDRPTTTKKSRLIRRRWKGQAKELKERNARTRHRTGKSGRAQDDECALQGPIRRVNSVVVSRRRATLSHSSTRPVQCWWVRRAQIELPAAHGRRTLKNRDPVTFAPTNRRWRRTTKPRLLRRRKGGTGMEWVVVWK